MTEDVRRWLESKGLVQYLDTFISNGYDDSDSVSCLDEEDLDAIGIIDPEHRDILQERVPPSPQVKAPQEDPPSAGQTDSMDFDQFESMLKDIDDMIGDLTSLKTDDTVTNGYHTHLDTTTSKEPSPPLKQPTFELETSDHHDDMNFDLEFDPTASIEEDELTFSPVSRHQVTSTVILGDVPTEGAQDNDIDLDSILNDLMAFDPGKAVAEAQLSQPTRPEPAQPMPAHVERQVPNGAPPQHTRSVPASQPVPQHPAKPARQERIEEEQETKAEEESPLSGDERKVLLTRKLSTYNSLNVRPPDASNVTSSTVLIKRTTTITSASDQITDADIQQRLQDFSQSLQSNPAFSSDEKDLKMKEEKMRIALEKMKLASKKKVIVKVFTEDGSSKAVVVDEDMTCAMVCHLLAVKNHADESPHWEMIERIGDMGLERVLEDHLNVLDIHTSWPRENKNVFMFKKNTEKFGLLENPLKFFPRHLGTDSKNVSREKQSERAKKILVSEYFSSSGRVPEVDGVLFMKDGYRKPWKKFYFMLRASGLYHSTKGKSTAPKNLVKFVTFQDHDVYSGINFKKLLHSPSPYCFCLKPHRGSSNPATAKDVKVFCAESAQSLVSWMAGIRMAKYGITLYDNYKRAFLTQFRVEETESVAVSEKLSSSVEQPPPPAQISPRAEMTPPAEFKPLVHRNEVPEPAPTMIMAEIHPIAAVTHPVPTPVAAPVPTPVVAPVPTPVVAPVLIPPAQQRSHLESTPPPVHSQAPASRPLPTKPTPYSRPKLPTLPPVNDSAGTVLSRPPTSPSHSSANQIGSAPLAAGQPPVRPKPKPSPPTERGFPPPGVQPVQVQPLAAQQPSEPFLPHPTPRPQAPSEPGGSAQFKKPPPPVPTRGGSHLSPVKKDSPPPVASKPAAPAVKPKPKPAAAPVIVPRPQPPPPEARLPSQPAPVPAPAPARDPTPRPPPKPLAKPVIQSGARVTNLGANQVFSPTATTPMMSQSFTDGPGGEDPTPPALLPREPAPRTYHTPLPTPSTGDPPRGAVHPYSHDLLARQQPHSNEPEYPSSSSSQGLSHPPVTSHQMDRFPPPLPQPRSQPMPSQMHKPAPPQMHQQAPPPLMYRAPPPEMPVRQISLSQLKNTTVDERPWFHGKISRDEAQIRIQTIGLHDGVYLVRESTTVNGCYVLTMFAYGVYRNFQIQKDCLLSGLDRFFIDDGPQFPSLDLLISHYSSDADRMPCKLTRCAAKPAGH